MVLVEGFSPVGQEHSHHFPVDNGDGSYEPQRCGKSARDGPELERRV